jgi:hypothetical protein
LTLFLRFIKLFEVIGKVTIARRGHSQDVLHRHIAAVLLELRALSSSSLSLLAASQSRPASRAALAMSPTLDLEICSAAATSRVLR